MSHEQRRLDFQQHHALYEELRRYINSTSFPDPVRLLVLVSEFGAVVERLGTGQ
jgi:hypothetical protein